MRTGNEPIQQYLVTIEFPIPTGAWGKFKTTFIFKVAPNPADILKAIRAQNSFYTDHAGAHEQLVQIGLALEDTPRASSGWNRIIPMRIFEGNATVTMRSTDFFDNS